MTDREALALRIATLKEAAEIVRKHGGKVFNQTGCACCRPEGSESRVSKAATELDDYIRDLQGDLRRIARA